MRSEFEIYIIDTYSPEQQDLFRECFKVFEEYDLEDYENSFMDLLMESDGKDSYQGSLEFQLLIKTHYSISYMFRVWKSMMKLIWAQ